MDFMFVVGLFIGNTGCASLIKQNGFGEGMGFHMQIFPLAADRVQIGGFHAEPRAILLGDLKIVETGLIGPVVILIHWIAQGAPGCDHLIQDIIALGWQRHIQRAPLPMIGISPLFAMFRAFEIGQDVFKAPAATAHLGPGIIVLSLAAHI